MVRIFLALLLASVVYPLRLTYSAWTGCPPASPDGGEIAYIHDFNYSTELFTMNADGSNPVRLTTRVGPDRHGVWSPDGSRIAFVGNSNGELAYTDSDIYVMQADGSAVVNLTQKPEGYWFPSWSPDGKEILFVQSQYQIGVVDVDAGKIRLLTTEPYEYYNPIWSPDGGKIADIRAEQNLEIQHVWIMDADGANPVQLTSDSHRDWNPVWSPDGSQLLFVRSLEYGNNAIYTIKADGSDERRLTIEPVDDSQPTWSPDGGRIAFSRVDEVWVMDADGSNASVLAEADEDVFSVHGLEWSPDGASILYEMLKVTGQGVNLYTVAVSDGSVTYLAQNEIMSNYATWSPDSAHILFTSDRERSAAELRLKEVFGAKPRRVVGGYNLGAPVWSPDSSVIALSAEIDGDDGIFTVGGDGHGLTYLSTESGGRRPAWSPDGARLAYELDGDIWVMNADGANPKQLTHEPVEEEYPLWSPDGQRIAYQKAYSTTLSVGGRMDAIFAMRADGSAQTQLTGYDLVLNWNERAGYSWAPESNQMVYSSWRPCGDDPPLQGASVDIPPRLRNLCHVNVTNGSVTTLIDGLLDYGYPQWSPDGRRISVGVGDPFATGAPTGLYILDLSNDEFYRVSNTSYGAAWSPDGTKMAVADSGIVVVEAVEQ